MDRPSGLSLQVLINDLFNALVDKGLALWHNCIVQILPDANSGGNRQQPYAEQASQVIEQLREILAKVAPPPPHEVPSLISRLEGAQAKDKSLLISKHVAFHRLRNILHRKPGLTMGELSQALSVPLYAATRMVDSLVATGLADRLSDADDRRVVRVTLTEDGRRLHQAIEAHVAQSIQRVMACLTPEEQGVLITLLRKVAASLKESKK